VPPSPPLVGVGALLQVRPVGDAEDILLWGGSIFAFGASKVVVGTEALGEVIGIKLSLMLVHEILNGGSVGAT